MSPPVDDELTRRLVKNLQAGHKVEDSARQLYERFSGKVFRFFLGKGVPHFVAEEHTQEVFLRVFKGIGSLRYDHDASFSSWLLEIARNLFKNWLRTAQTKKREGLEVSLRSESEEREGGTEETLVDEAPDPLAQLTENEQIAALRVAIAGLSEQRRRCCELRYIEGLKYREVADEMSISIETVKAHLHQARAVLEAALVLAGWKLPSPVPAKEVN